ncbi:MAG TPA: thiamine phosphate synthase [Methylophilaceae bacterium]|nr:thiamine phosphate synthase [Methylophilaceae bacterium]
MITRRISGLYAITPDEVDTSRLQCLVEAALQGGASIIQYRNKSASRQLRFNQATGVLAICRSHGVPLIINDHLDLCLEVDAEGLHVGSEDHAADELARIRARLGSKKILGVSCYNRFELAEQAASHGADYVAFGSCFDSGTKPAAVRAPLDLFSRARDALPIPVVAIGGITLDNAPQVIEAGADAVAVIGALFSASDISDTARQFSQLFYR